MNDFSYPRFVFLAGNFRFDDLPALVSGAVQHSNERVHEQELLEAHSTQIRLFPSSST